MCANSLGHSADKPHSHLIGTPLPSMPCETATSAAITEAGENGVIVAENDCGSSGIGKSGEPSPTGKPHYSGLTCAAESLSSGAPLPDEWFELQEKQLNERKRQLGQNIERMSMGLTACLPSKKQQRAKEQIKLLEIIGQLAEIREVRRALLGLGDDAHIRPRAMPNFVVENPSYAKVVADELPEAEAMARQIK